MELCKYELPCDGAWHHVKHANDVTGSEARGSRHDHCLVTPHVFVTLVTTDCIDLAAPMARRSICGDIVKYTDTHMLTPFMLFLTLCPRSNTVSSTSSLAHLSSVDHLLCVFIQNPRIIFTLPGCFSIMFKKIFYDFKPPVPPKEDGKNLIQGQALTIFDSCGSTPFFSVISPSSSIAPKPPALSPLSYSVVLSAANIPPSNSSTANYPS